VLQIERNARIHVCGTTGLSQVLRTAGFQPTGDTLGIEAVVVGWNPKLAFGDIRHAADLARSGVPLVAANRDATYPGTDGLLPGTGAIVAAIETASGATATAVGKPAPEMFRFALEQAGTAPGRTLVIGDRLSTDIAGARAAGLPSALVLTGVSSADDIAASDAKPDWILDALDDLVREGARPGGSSADAVIQDAARSASPAERNDEQEPDEEPADVGEEGDAAARLLVRGVSADSGEELSDEPQADHDEGGRADREEEEPERDQREHARARPDEDVRAEDPGYRARGSDDGDGGVDVEDDVEQRGAYPADEIEDQETYTAEPIFDVVPEDPEEEHVESEMEDVRVHEHRREHRGPRGSLGEQRLDLRREDGAMSGQIAGHEAVAVDERA
jgi:hypothetical protein